MATSVYSLSKNYNDIMNDLYCIQESQNTYQPNKKMCSNERVLHLDH